MTDIPALLIAFSGLPGTGKTTLARAVAIKLDAAFLRVDTIEQVILTTIVGCEVGVAGYAVGNAIAEDNLFLGRHLVADCVNPVEASRAGWRDVAQRASARILEVEVICSDRAEHQRRVEERRSDIAGRVLPSWAAINALVYEPWTTPRLVVDTASLSASAAADAVVSASV